jgi:hypothetical protein
MQSVRFSVPSTNPINPPSISYDQQNNGHIHRPHLFVQTR